MVAAAVTDCNQAHSFTCICTAQTEPAQHTPNTRFASISKKIFAAFTDCGLSAGVGQEERVHKYGALCTFADVGNQTGWRSIGRHSSGKAFAEEHVVLLLSPSHRRIRCLLAILRSRCMLHAWTTRLPGSRRVRLVARV